MNERGTYIEHEGRPAVRFVRSYPHPVERVWAAVTDPAQLKAWFPSQVEIEPRVGGRLVFTGDPYAPDGTGEVLVYEPPTRISYTWYDDVLHLEIAPTADGCTLTFIDVLDARDAAARNAAGWDDCLVALDHLVDGRPGPGPHDMSVDDWHKTYDDYVAAGLPSGAEMPDPA